jgi:hypothetical protein
MGVLAVQVVAGPVHHHALVDQALDPPLGQGDLFFPGQFLRQGDVELPGELGILPLLRGLDAVPQGLAIAHPRRSAGRQGDGDVVDAGLPPEVIDVAGALVVQDRPGAVGGCGHDLLPAGPSDGLGVEVEDGHGRGQGQGQGF